MSIGIKGPPTSGRKRSGGAGSAQKLSKRLRRAHSVVCGLDISASRLAIVALCEPTPRILKVDFRKPWVPLVCAHAQKEAEDFIASVQNNQEWRADCWIESPLVGRGGVRPTIVQSFVSGAVQAGLIGIGCRVTLITASEWKQITCGNGNANKADVARRIRSRWPDHSALADGDGDVLDAFGIAHAGAARRGPLGTQGAVSPLR